MKSWSSHLDEINEIQKKESFETKKSGTDTEKAAPTEVEAKDDKAEETKDAETKGEAETMEQTETSKPAAEAEPPKFEDKAEEAVGEEYEMVEGGGEVDELAQGGVLRLKGGGLPQVIF